MAISVFGKVKCILGKRENVDYTVVLTQYHTTPHFDTLKIYSCGKHEKRRNCLEQAISPFLTMFFYPKWHLFFISDVL